MRAVEGCEEGDSNLSELPPTSSRPQNRTVFPAAASAQDGQSGTKPHDLLTNLLTADPALDRRVSRLLDLASAARGDFQLEAAEVLLAALEAGAK